VPALGHGRLAQLARQQPCHQRGLMVLVAEVDGHDAALGHGPRPLQAGDRLADAGLAPDEQQLPRVHAAAQHVVEGREARGTTGRIMAAGLGLVELDQRREGRAQLLTSQVGGDDARHRAQPLTRLS
jgi:hypothetical protein